MCFVLRGLGLFDLYLNQICCLLYRSLNANAVFFKFSDNRRLANS